MKFDTLIDGHQRKYKVQAKVPERPSVMLSVCLKLSPLLILWLHALFCHDFYIFYESQHNTREHKTEFLSLMV